MNLCGSLSGRPHVLTQRAAGTASSCLGAGAALSPVNLCRPRPVLARLSGRTKADEPLRGSTVRRGRGRPFLSEEAAMPKRRKPAPAPPMAPDLVFVLAILRAAQAYLEAVMPKDARSEEEGK